MLRPLRVQTPFLFGLLVLTTGIFVAEYWGLYARIQELDSILHVLGGIAVAWTVLALFQDTIRRLSTAKKLLVIVGITGIVGILWEFAEYLSNFSKNTYPLLYHYFHGGGPTDTLIDVIADVTGGILVTAWAVYKERG